MTITSQVSLSLSYTQGLSGTQVIPTTANVNAPGDIDVKTFVGAGDNLITVPTGGTAPTGVIIVPPVGNVQALVLKGLAGDTGIKIHKTEPTYLSLDSTVVNFILNIAGTVTGIRFIWN